VVRADDGSTYVWHLNELEVVDSVPITPQMPIAWMLAGPR
jgi:hypothetical protein